MPRPRSLLRLLLPLLFLFVAVAAGAAPRAVGGRLELPANRGASVALEGEWGFAWNTFVDPRWTTLPTQAVAPVPGNWNKLPGKAPGEEGWGSYVLQVDCPRGDSLAVEAVGQRTASRLFVNGTEVAAHGVPGHTREETWAAVHTRNPISAEFACPLRITLHLANFDHRAGGFVRPIFAGPVDVLDRERETRLVRSTALLGAYVITGLIGLIFYAVRRKERVTLYFGLFCFLIAIYTDLLGERLFLRFLGPQVSWFSYMRLEYLSWIGAMSLFLLTLRGLFPQDIPIRAVYVVLAMLGVGVASTLALPPSVYSYIVLPGQAIAVVVAGYIAFRLARAGRDTRVEAQVLMAGVLAIVVALAVDLLLIDTSQPNKKFMPIGFALFLLSPAVVIARRLSQALNAEERSRTLEENARLREDVERISRHDLKTPLNSILGAARLLQDDPRLAGDQQELVGVLQRAGLRMVEMVNLSMGLFRMETGSYELRPQPVDLRALVSRVLVDLRPSAEAAGVTLVLQTEGRRPVVARAEELLCYSIVANLVKNAIEASAAGQRVTLALHPGDPVRVTVHNAREVAPDIVPRFFDKYVTGGKSGGTGLGTYSAHLMATAQHGTLALETGAAGTTLTLTLPASREAPATLATPATAQRAHLEWLRNVPTRDVLLVDDDELTRLVTRRLLPTPPFHVETAANGQLAIEMLARRRPAYLLIDMEMPVRNGIETVQWLRSYEAAEGGPRCHVIMMSGNDDTRSIERAMQAGVDRFLTKPVSPERLLGALRELETGEAAPPPADPPTSSTFALTEAPPTEPLAIDGEWREMFPDLMRLQRDAVESMAQALERGDRDNLAFLAHRSFGALSALGMHWAAGQSRIVERNAQLAAPEDLAPRIEALREYLANVAVEYR